MPVVIEIKTKSGKVSTIKLPVEIWERNSSWTFNTNTTEEIETITLDPENAFPDINSLNNVWSTITDSLERVLILDEYLGTYSTTLAPIKFIFTEENGTLIGEAIGQGKFPLVTNGKDKFKIEGAPVEFNFNETKTEVTLVQDGQNIVFTKEK